MPERCPLGSAPRTLRAKVQVAELAKRQFGVVTRAQLAESAVAQAEIVRWVDERRLHRVYPGVYAVGHDSLAIEGRLAAALFYAGKGATLSHTTAGWWWGILTAKPTRLHVAAPGRRRSLKDVQVHCRRSCERVWHKRLPLTPPAQTLLDIACVLSLQMLRRALAEAEHRRLVTADDVAAVLGRGKPGSAALRVALERHRPELAQTRSHMEEAFALLCERVFVKQPRFNVWIAGWLVDTVWFEERVVVELDSRTAHSTARAIENDHRRDLDLRAAGFTVLRYTWRQLTEETERVVADVRRHGIS